MENVNKAKITDLEANKNVQDLEEMMTEAEGGYDLETAELVKQALDRVNGVLEKIDTAEEISETTEKRVEDLGGSKEVVEEKLGENTDKMEELKEDTQEKVKEVENVVEGGDMNKQKEFLVSEEKRLYSQFLEIDSKKQELEKQFLSIQNERQAQFEKILSEQINPSAMEINRLQYKDFSENIYPKILKNGFSNLDLSSPYINNIIEDVKNNTDSGLIRQSLLELASPLTMENLSTHQRALFDIIKEAKTNESRLLKRFEIDQYRKVNPGTKKLINEFKDILKNISIELKTNPDAYKEKSIPESIFAKNSQEQNEYNRIILEKPEEIIGPIDRELDLKYPEFKSLQEKYHSVSEEYNRVNNELSKINKELKDLS